MTTRVPLLVLATMLAPTSAFTQTWETIDPDYRNVRGINYVAAYEGITQPGFLPLGYNGVAGPTAMWRFSTEPSSSAEIDQQLDWILGLGLNSVRIWISYPLWYADRDQPTNRMVDALADFLARCETRHLYVIPVLWDAHCTGAEPCLEPDYGDPVGMLPPHRNISHWTPNPGPTKIGEFAASGFQSPDFVDFVTEIVQAGMNSPALMMWDIMNEPVIGPGDPNHHDVLVNSTLALCKQVAPTNLTTVGFTGVFVGGAVEPTVQNPDMDVISVHAYGTFRDNVQAYVDNAAWITDPAGAPLKKPILITEIGNPGWGQPYTDVLQNLAATQQGPQPNPSLGVGFFLFSLMNGWHGGNFPYRELQGIYFLDGEVRDAHAAIAIQNVARHAAVPSMTLTTGFVQKSELDTTYYPQAPLYDGHDFDDSVRNLGLPEWYYGLMSDSEGLQFARLFEILFYDVSTLTLGPNPTLAIDPMDAALSELIAEVYFSGQLWGQTLTLAQRNALLNTWRFLLLPYVAELDGATASQ